MRPKAGHAPYEEAIREILQKDDEVFEILDPKELTERPLISEERATGGSAAGGEFKGSKSGGLEENATSTLTYSQKKKRKNKEVVLSEPVSLKPESLNPDYAEKMRAKQARCSITAS